MKLYKTTDKSYIEFEVNADAREVAVSDIKFDTHLAYCDEDADAITGPELLEIGECRTREQFMSEINKIGGDHGDGTSYSQAIYSVLSHNL